MGMTAIALALLAALAVPALAHSGRRAGGTARVYRDCGRDGTLDGSYPIPLLRKALDEMPGDLARYTSCPRELRRALATRVRTRAGDARVVRAIYHECMRGDVYRGHPLRLLRRALHTMPSDLAEYTDCSDRIRSAIRRAQR
jgi:hypothetical protein